jgi:DNA polymerase I-like protein with 3'-5' exonuclease and polymerase domains
MIYGMGLGTLAVKMEVNVDTARTLRQAYLKTFDGLEDMNKDMKRRSRDNEPIRTWGGREYYCEPPVIIHGKLRTFDYKMLNKLIQGSAADCTKEGICRYHEAGGKRMLLTVHDEFLNTAPKAEAEEEMQLLKQTIESVEFDLPMLSEGKWSSTSWYNMTDYDVKGEKKGRIK